MIMRVSGSIELIGTSFNFITLEVVVVSIIVIVRSKFIRIPSDGQFLNFTWLKILGLTKGDKLDDGFLNTTRGIWSFDVDFNNILTGNITSIGDINSSSIGLDTLSISFTLGNIEVIPLESGVGKTITKWIDNVSVIPVIGISKGIAKILAT